jgi:hypothetical protein
MANGECGMRNAECGMAKGECGMANAEWRRFVAGRRPSWNSSPTVAKLLPTFANRRS